MFLTFEIALWNVQLRLFGIISIIVDVSNNRLIWTGSPPFCERGSLVGYLDFNPVLIVARLTLDVGIFFTPLQGCSRVFQVYFCLYFHKYIPHLSS